MAVGSGSVVTQRVATFLGERGGGAPPQVLHTKVAPRLPRNFLCSACDRQHRVGSICFLQFPHQASPIGVTFPRSEIQQLFKACREHVRAAGCI